MEGSSSSRSKEQSTAKTQGGHKVNEPLTGKPWVGVFICQSHLRPHYNMIMPKEMTDRLPEKDVPVVLRCEGKEWNMVYYGAVRCKIKRFSAPQWRQFAEDNGLIIDDALVFELMECTEERLEFKVQILKEEMSPALQARLDGKHRTSLRRRAG